jgi:hypothetical protein
VELLNSDRKGAVEPAPQKNGGKRESRENS